MATLEDLFGTTGNRFQGAIGFITREANAAPEAISGYGVGVDDVVIEWREFTLQEDSSDCDATCVGGEADGQPCAGDADCAGGQCGGGSCATINLSTNNVFQGNTRLQITVADTTRSGNDCDFDGTTDVPQDFDCNDNLIEDVVVRVDSPQEVQGEYVVLEAQRVGGSVFSGSVPISSTYDTPGSLFIGTQGAANPTVRATYIDEDDGTGRPCQASVDPEAWGQVSVQTTVFLTPASLVVRRARLEDNGDDDGWADQGETVDVTVEVSNISGSDVTGLRLLLTSNDPDVACITKPVIDFGDLARGEARFGSGVFRFVVSQDADRVDPLEELTATLNVSMHANEFQTLLAPQEIVLDLDLDATGGGPPTTYFESFEGGFGSFTTMHIDETLNPPDSDLGNRAAGVLNADGHRCQYSDPDWQGSASYGNSQGQQCFPNPNGAQDAFWFHIVTDRAYSGVQSLGFNSFLDAARGWTTPNSQLEALRTIDPVNLGWARVCTVSRTVNCDDSGDCPAGEGCEPAQPLLSIKHQVSHLDHRSVNAQPGRGADKGIVAVQLADLEGVPVGPWIKAQPFVNVYDSVANSNYFNCKFDPADDGNTEEDFFDPSDPNRSQGPSSMCAPGFSFMDQGDTDDPFDPANLGDASDGPGLAGALGIGTWVEPQIDLSRFRGRRVRIRFVETGLKLGGSVVWEQAFNFNPDPGDDGWFIDDVTVVDAIMDPPAVVSADTKDNSALPVCADLACGQDGGVVADIALVPANGVTPAPGQAIELDASGSTVDVCLSGVLQYRYWVETNGTATFEPAVDVMLRDWTDNPRLSDTPQGATAYGVSVRCATDPSCQDTRVLPIDVDCPSSGEVTSVDTTTPFLHRSPPNRRSIRVDGTVSGTGKLVTVYWTTGATVDAIRGDLASLRSAGFGGETCLLDDHDEPRRLEDAAAVPNDGDGVWYLLRSKAYCNEPTAGGSYGGVGEASATERDAVDACGG